jgi:hypothetical protein
MTSRFPDGHKRIEEEEVMGRHGTPHIRRTVVMTCCGGDVECHSFTNTCDKCGADYNTAGQRLAPRSQWGEETGETLDEILSVDSPRSRF